LFFVIFVSVVIFVVPSAAAGTSDVADAAQRRDTAAVRALLNARADVNAPQGDGATALHWAAHWDDLDTADRLVRAGANVDAANDYGVTPLMLACTNRSAAFVGKLLAARANPNAAQINGVTALVECARTGATDAVGLLLARGASVQAAHVRSGQTALTWAIEGRHSAVVRLLLARGADARTPSKGGFTPLMFAARSGDLESARLLVDAGAAVDAGTADVGTPLVVAAASGHEALAIFLLEQGANPNAVDRNGITALHNAVQRGLTSLVGTRYDESYRVQPPNMPQLAGALLARGASVNARIAANDPRGPDGTPFSMKGATPFFLAAVSADAALMRLLGARGADPRLAADGGTTPLIAAARSACTGSCEFKASGANLELDPGIEHAALDAVTAAVELGGDVNGADQDGYTAMHMAAFTGAESIVKFLADRGAVVDVRNKLGETPWSMAAGLSPVLRYRGQYGSHEGTAKLLLSLGAKPFTQDELDTRAASAR
jgi:ankyrin repeat protein